MSRVLVPETRRAVGDHHGESPSAQQGPPDSSKLLEWNMKDKAAVMFLRQAMTLARTKESQPPSTRQRSGRKLEGQLQRLHHRVSACHPRASSWTASSTREEDVEAFLGENHSPLRQAERGGGRGVQDLPHDPGLPRRCAPASSSQSLGGAREDLRQIRPSRIDLQDLLQRMRAFELNTRAQAGAANRVGMRIDTPLRPQGSSRGHQEAHVSFLLARVPPGVHLVTASSGETTSSTTPENPARAQPGSTTSSRRGTSWDPSPGQTSFNSLETPLMTGEPQEHVGQAYSAYLRSLTAQNLPQKSTSGVQTQEQQSTCVKIEISSQSTQPAPPQVTSRVQHRACSQLYRAGGKSHSSTEQTKE